MAIPLTHYRCRKKINMKCERCQQEFTPKRAYYALCPTCYYAANGRTPPHYCAAVKADGKPCQRYAVHGESFCTAHLRQGYALFSRAAAVQQNKKGVEL